MTSYKDIRDTMMQRIMRQHWAPGELLPNEHQLAQEFACTRATVNRAMRELAATGLIERRRKAGTRVVQRESRGAVLTIALTRKEIEDKGQRYDYLLLQRAIQPAPEKIRMELALSAEQDALQVTCLHFADNEPYQLEQRWINLAVVPAAAQQRFTDASPNEWLIGEVPYSEAEHVFSAHSATPEEQQQLQLKVDEPVFMIERRTRIAQQYITYVRLLHPGLSYRLRASG